MKTLTPTCKCKHSPSALRPHTLPTFSSTIGFYCPTFYKLTVHTHAHTATPHIQSWWSLGVPPYMFAFCHQDCLRRLLNPLPGTKATNHHCNQIPATFHCFFFFFCDNEIRCFFSSRPSPQLRHDAGCALLDLTDTANRTYNTPQFEGAPLYAFGRGNEICRGEHVSGDSVPCVTYRKQEVKQRLPFVNYCSVKLKFIDQKSDMMIPQYNMRKTHRPLEMDSAVNNWTAIELMAECLL